MSEAAERYNNLVVTLLGALEEFRKNGSELTLKDESVETLLESMGKILHAIAALPKNSSPEIVEAVEAFDILRKCLKEPKTFMPLLLRPLDQFEWEGPASQALVLDETKMRLLNQSTLLFSTGIKGYQQTARDGAVNDIAKLLRQKEFKDREDLKKTFEQFKELFVSQLKDLNSYVEALRKLLADPGLLHIEERLICADVEKAQHLLAAILQAQKTMNEKYNETCKVIPGEWRKFREMADTAKGTKAEKPSLELLEQHLTKMEMGFEMYLRHTNFLAQKLVVNFIQLHHEQAGKIGAFREVLRTHAPVTNTTCSYVRWIDALTLSLFHPFFEDVIFCKEDQIGISLENARDLIASILSFATEASLAFQLRLSLDQQPMFLERPGFLNQYSRFLEHHGNIHTLSKEIKNSQVYPFSLLGSSKNPEIQIDLGMPYLYSSLRGSIGPEHKIDSAALQFFELQRRAAQLYQKNAQRVLSELAKEIAEPGEVLVAFFAEMKEFHMTLRNILETPLLSEKEVRRVARELYDHFRALPVLFSRDKELRSDEETLEYFFGIGADLVFLKYALLRSLLEIAAMEPTATPFKPQSLAVKAHKQRALQAPKTKRIKEPEPASQKIKEPVLPKVTLSEYAAVLSERLKEVDTGTFETPKNQIMVLRNERREQSLGNVQHHLRALKELFSAKDCSYLRFEAIQKSCGFLLESSLQYLFGYFNMNDREGKSVVISNQSHVWQHKPLKMVDMLRSSGYNLDLSEEETHYLESIGAILSKAGYPSVHLATPRVNGLVDLQTTLTSEASEERTIALKSYELELQQEAFLAMKLCNQFFSLSQVADEFSAPLPPVQEKTLEDLKQIPLSCNECSLLDPIRASTALLETDLSAALDPIPAVGGETYWQQLTRSSQILNHFSDIPHHMHAIQEGFPLLEKGQMTSSLVNELFLHLSLLAEKSLKIGILYFPIPSSTTANQHVGFEKIQQRPRIYDHHLERNASLLKKYCQAENGVAPFPLSEGSSSALKTFAEYISQHSRYPIGQKGEIAEVMQYARLLSRLSQQAKSGFFTEAEDKWMQQACGKDKSLWAKTISEKWKSIQIAELLPRAKALFLASEETLHYLESLFSGTNVPKLGNQPEKG